LKLRASGIKEDYMGSSNIKAVIILQLIFLVTTLPCLAWEKVSFRHKTAKPPTFKLECRKIQGKHDAHPTYKCYDKEGNSEAFDPKNEWEEVTIEIVCFRHMDRDNIRGCMKFLGKQDYIEHVGCADAKGNLNIFLPDPKKWEELEADNLDCKPRIIEMYDVPRGGTIDLIDD
jgi:hypothetical protein